MAVIAEAAENPDLDSCDICGRRVFSGNLVFSELSESFLCEDCCAEEVSCGCTDDVS